MWEDTKTRKSAVVGVTQDRGYQLLWGEKRERISAVVGGNKREDIRCCGGKQEKGYPLLWGDTLERMSAVVGDTR